MKKNLSIGLSFLAIVLFMSASLVNAEKFDWYFNVLVGDTGHRSFTVSKDNLFLQMTIEVYEGGPINIFILDNNTFTAWNFGNGEVVSAYLGGTNISEGSKITIEGNLGTANVMHTDYTTIVIDVNTTVVNSSITNLGVREYILVVDNRDGNANALVDVSILTTVDTTTVLTTLSALVFVAFIAVRRRKWKKSPFLNIKTR
ncbi:MAG: hypothetical protein KAU62_14115 [Candidatus Heimdallarchaeota archaeon]|nr:hypothetical protein [Candidatus Heimdallarchaeota archaeon]MCG3257229.1 hypothetical protein [Candidatus Heimdallarchaeota archaeon]MCK4612287.1 hypothetical protein [Candidatus Heimdallarchaeota archaeon]